MKGDPVDWLPGGQDRGSPDPAESHLELPDVEKEHCIGSRGAGSHSLKALEGHIVNPSRLHLFLCGKLEFPLPAGVSSGGVPSAIIMPLAFPTPWPTQDFSLPAVSPGTSGRSQTSLSLCYPLSWQGFCLCSQPTCSDFYESIDRVMARGALGWETEQ